MSIRLIAYIAAVAVAAVCIAYGLGRWQGSAAERRACEAEIHAAELTAERQARESERKAREAQDAIVQDYEHQIADYRRTVDAYVDADRLSDARTCKDLPRAPGAQPGLVCYTRADIQRKVAESLALAAECDEIAIRYKAVVRAYESVRADR
ncbi:hypothetical protein ACR73B_16810 [Enterococcus innesii]|uniref:hypothetical protein n=1 Tax=Enterococcus innesii TaxID=2839759 RepID=UPI003DA2680A